MLLKSAGTPQAGPAGQPIGIMPDLSLIAAQVQNQVPGPPIDVAVESVAGPS
jgi:hypothetical protein